MKPLMIHGMFGLGDSIYQRAFVKHVAVDGRQVFIDTPWPQLYADIPVRFVLQPRRLRTQMKNAQAMRFHYEHAPIGAEELRVSYGHDLAVHGSIVEAMRHCFRLPKDAKLVFDLPDMGPSPVKTDKPIALLRPATIRTEWRNEARNPDPVYLAQAGTFLRSAGFHVVVVADLKQGEEWLCGDMPEADQRFVNGELTMPQLLALARAASIIVGGVGWIVPAAVALGVPTFVVLGGMAGHNAPEVILPPHDVPNIEFAYPERFCRCTVMRHVCVKTIPSFLDKLAPFAARALPRSSRKSRRAA